MASLLVITFSKSVSFLLLILIALPLIISRASLLLLTILLFTSISIKLVLSTTSNVGTSLIEEIISSLDKFHILSENKDSLIFRAFSYSSLPCKKVIISLAKAF